MHQLPTYVVEYILNLTLEQRSPAYLLVDEEGFLLEYGGRLDLYGIGDLRLGRAVEPQVYFLEGLLPPGRSSFTIPLVSTRNGSFFDIHVFHGEVGHWILLMDSTREAKQKEDYLRLIADWPQPG